MSKKQEELNLLSNSKDLDDSARAKAINEIAPVYAQFNKQFVEFKNDFSNLKAAIETFKTKKRNDAEENLLGEVNEKNEALNVDFKNITDKVKVIEECHQNLAQLSKKIIQTNVKKNNFIEVSGNPSKYDKFTREQIQYFNDFTKELQSKFIAKFNQVKQEIPILLNEFTKIIKEKDELLLKIKTAQKKLDVKSQQDNSAVDNKQLSELLKMMQDLQKQLTAVQQTNQDLKKQVTVLQESDRGKTKQISALEQRIDSFTKQNVATIPVKTSALPPRPNSASSSPTAVKNLPPPIPATPAFKATQQTTTQSATVANKPPIPQNLKPKA